MNLITRLFLLCFLIGTLSGCLEKGSQQSADHEDEEFETGVTFNPSHGLRVAPETARFIELKTSEVEERAIASEFRFSAQVFRTGEIRPVAHHSGAKGNNLASADVSPEDARMLHADQSVTVALDDGTSFTGRIKEIHPHNEKAGSHMDVTIAADSKEALRAGSFVNVRVPVGGDKKVLSIPRSALLETAEGQFVYASSGEYFVRTPVKIGIRNAEFLEVTDGLYAGDTVAVQPVMALWMAELQSIRGGKACADGH